jgi:hypothetical protein
VDGLLPVVGALETHYELERKKKLSKTLNKSFLVESACSWRVIHYAVPMRQVISSACPVVNPQHTILFSTRAKGLSRLVMIRYMTLVK